ncbi:MAG: penicillin acylase family protein [Phycisphaerales bacterium]
MIDAAVASHPTRRTASTRRRRRVVGTFSLASIACSAAVSFAAGEAEPISLGGLAAPATASIDALGVPLIRAASFDDAVRVEGYLHARDRYAQMDLLRRYAAGELAEILGPFATAVDRQQRVLRLRAVARADLDALEPRHRTALKAYVEGVNAGLASMPGPPAEHKLLGVKPAPWTEEDTMLVALSMCAMLNDSARNEPAIGAVAAILPASMLAYLSTPFSTSDAPVIADATPPEPPAIPGPEVIDTRQVKTSRANLRETRPARPEALAGAASDALVAVTPGTLDRAHPVLSVEAWAEPLVGALLRGHARIAAGDEDLPGDEVIGSNAWVVSGARSSTGAAILANDMHLAITVPGVWYRVSLEFGAGSDHERRVRVDGISLPGAPGIVSGSNGRIAWGFTNVEGDFIDYVVVEPDPNDATRYLVPGGSEPYRSDTETVRVRGLPSQSLDVKSTRWGPIVATDHANRPLAMRWPALDAGGINLAILDLAAATTVSEGLDIAAAWRGAQQNVMIAADNGDIGWTISGALPRRSGFDGQVPTSWADGARGWNGWLDGPDRPRIENPAAGFIVTANQRTVPAVLATQIGHLWGEPDRASQISAALRAAPPLDERGCAALQLRTDVPKLDLWRAAVLPSLERAAADVAADGQPTDRARRVGALVETLRGWNGKADADERAVAVIDQVRKRATRAILRGIVEAALAANDPSVSPEQRATKADRLSRVPARDESVLRIVRERSQHLLPPSEESWDAFLVRVTLEAAASASGKDGLLPWGKINTSDFEHPLAQAAPQITSQFGIPQHEQPGHPGAIRVASPSFGASDRLVVSPGREANGLIQTPGGQSGDPKSSHYADLHPSWRDGMPLSLRPGAAATTLSFQPVATTAPEPQEQTAPPSAAPSTPSAAKP